MGHLCIWHRPSIFLCRIKRGTHHAVGHDRLKNGILTPGTSQSGFVSALRRNTFPLWSVSDARKPKLYDTRIVSDTFPIRVAVNFAPHRVSDTVRTSRADTLIVRDRWQAWLAYFVTMGLIQTKKKNKSYDEYIPLWHSNFSNHVCQYRNLADFYWTHFSKNGARTVSWCSVSDTVTRDRGKLEKSWRIEPCPRIAVSDIAWGLIVVSFKYDEN